MTTSYSNLYGIFWILVCKFSFALMLGLVKFLNIYPTLQLNFIRSLTVLGFALPLLLRRGLQSFKVTQIWVQIARVICGAFGIMCFFYTFRMLPLAKATTLMSSQTLVVPIMASLFLKEHIGWKRWFAVVVGYIGIWVAVRPDYGDLEFAEMVGMVGAVLAAGANVAAKKLVSSHSPLLLMFYSAVTSVVLLGGFWIISPCLLTHFPTIEPWEPLRNQDLFFLLLTGILAMIAQYSYLKAYKFSDISFLAPFDYTKFLFSISIGYFIFQEIPDLNTWLGILLIVISTFYITHQEMSVKHGS
jgi:drug/metabolite transporter (DMT)-like permease